MSLSSVASHIAGAALMMGGSDIRWYKSIPCPGLRDDGTPCYREDRGESWVECPICHGLGAAYDAPRMTRGIFSENSDMFMEDSPGGNIEQHATLSLPRNLPITIVKDREGEAARRFLRDKFELLGPCCDHNGKRPITRTLYLFDNTVNPTVDGATIYQIVRVSTNH